MEKSKNQTLVPELREACAKADSLVSLRDTYISFKSRLDYSTPTQNDACREIYWANKRRIQGRM